MKNLTLTFVLLILVSASLYAQGLAGKRISLRARSYVSSKEFFMETICGAKGIEIKFKIKDSLSIHKLASDSIYQVLLKSLYSSNLAHFEDDTLKNLTRKIDSATVANTVYSTERVKISYNQYAAYEKLLRSLFSSSMLELENKENNQHRMVLDGTGMNFKFYQNDTIQSTAYAHSPTKISHPLLYDYLTATLDLYRSIKKNTLVTKAQTTGY